MYPNDTSKQNFSDKAATWQSRYSKAAGTQTSMFDKFDEWYKMMYAIRDDKNIAKWRSKVHIPMLSTKAWNLIAKFVQQEPGFEVTVRNDDDPDKPEMDINQLESVGDKVQRRLEYEYHNPELDEPIRDKLNTCLVDATVTGTGLAKVPWVVKKKKLYSHPIKDGQVDYEKDKVTSYPLGYNDLEPVNIFDVFVAPSATSLQTAPWIIIKNYKTLAQLKAVNSSYGVEVYKNLDKLKGVKSPADRFALQKKARQNLTSDQDPIIEDDTVGLIELFECYERDTNKICTYAGISNEKGTNNKWLIVREQTNPYWHGKFPLVAFYIRRRPFHFWGESLFETTQRLQSAANDLFNHYLDNWNLSVDGGIMIEETSQVSDFLVEPGFELVYRGEQPKQFSFPAPDPNQLTLVMNQIEKSLEQATISNYAMGSPISGLDKTQGTARGTLAILEAATDMIIFMRDNFTQAIKQVGEMWLSNNRQFMNFEFPVPTLKNNRLEEVTLTPEELQLQMELRISDLSMQPISEQQRRENFIAYLSQLLQLQKASIEQSMITKDQNQMLFADWHSLASDLARHYSVRGAHKQMLPNDQALAVQNQMASGQQTQAEAMAMMEQEEANKGNEMDAMMEEISDLPDDDKVNQAEAALEELNV